MAAVAQPASQGQEPSDALVQAFVKFINDSSHTSDVSIDQIKASVAATVAEPGGQAYLDQILSTSPVTTTAWKFSFPSTADVNIDFVGFQIKWTGTPPSAAVTALVATSKVAQITKAVYLAQNATLFYNDPADLQKINPYSFTTSAIPQPKSVILDFKTPASPDPVFRLVFGSAPQFSITGGGTAVWI